MAGNIVKLAGKYLDEKLQLDLTPGLERDIRDVRCFRFAFPNLQFQLLKILLLLLLRTTAFGHVGN
jgi:hypothetical protein